MGTLANDFARDIITDIRFSRRKIVKGIHVEDETRYVEQCLDELRKVFKNRHNLKLNRYGYPKILEK